MKNTTTATHAHFYFLKHIMYKIIATPSARGLGCYTTDEYAAMQAQYRADDRARLEWERDAAHRDAEREAYRQQQFALAMQAAVRIQQDVQRAQEIENRRRMREKREERERVLGGWSVGKVVPDACAIPMQNEEGEREGEGQPDACAIPMQNGEGEGQLDADADADMEVAVEPAPIDVEDKTMREIVVEVLAREPGGMHRSAVFATIDALVPGVNRNTVRGALTASNQRIESVGNGMWRVRD
jgi:hypothetical protein